MNFTTLSKEDVEKTKKVDPATLSKEEKRRLIDKLSREMNDAAKVLDFETAAKLRDEIRRLQGGK